jgi:hypothetical protein
MLQIAQTFHRNTIKHHRANKTKRYWFKCFHNLPVDFCFEFMRSNKITFDIYLGHYNIPLTVKIKKIRHLKRSRFGKRIKLILIHIKEKKEYSITAIYNTDNDSMIVHSVPKFLFTN